MEVLYSSTRSKGTQVKASEAILKGLSDDGGLFVPNQIIVTNGTYVNPTRKPIFPNQNIN